MSERRFSTVILRQLFCMTGQASTLENLLREKHPVLMLQVDGGELVIGTAENFWHELSKVQFPSRHMVQFLKMSHSKHCHRTPLSRRQHREALAGVCI